MQAEREPQISAGCVAFDSQMQMINIAELAAFDLTLLQFQLG